MSEAFLVARKLSGQADPSFGEVLKGAMCRVADGSIPKAGHLATMEIFDEN